MDSSEFYNQLAPFYHLIYPDWQKSIIRQGQMLNAMIEHYGPRDGKDILDVSCGIGTQSISLAQNGYQVTASDLSASSIERAEKEAQSRHLQIQFSVADMRNAYQHHQREFDVVLSCDNSVPHLLSDADIRQAFHEFYKCTRNGGCCIISVRDYEQEPKDGTVVKPYGIRKEQEMHYLLFQVWEFKDEIYQTSLYVIQDDGKPVCTTHVMKAYYYAVRISKLIHLLEQVGFKDVKRLDDIFFQPVIIGRK